MSDARKRQVVVDGKVYDSLVDGAKAIGIHPKYFCQLISKSKSAGILHYKGHVIRYLSVLECIDELLEALPAPAKKPHQPKPVPKSGALIPNLCTHRLGAYIN